jgi:hypothetical protein
MAVFKCGRVGIPGQDDNRRDAHVAQSGFLSLLEPLVVVKEVTVACWAGGQIYSPGMRLHTPIL